MVLAHYNIGSEGLRSQERECAHRILCLDIHQPKLLMESPMKKAIPLEVLVAAVIASCHVDVVCTFYAYIDVDALLTLVKFAAFMATLVLGRLSRRKRSRR